MFKYIKNSFEELNKVVFPKTEEVLSNFKMVVIFTTILTIYLAGLDLGIKTFLQTIFN